MIVRCYIERNKSMTNKLSPVYTLYADYDDGTGRMFLSSTSPGRTKLDIWYMAPQY